MSPMDLSSTLNEQLERLSAQSKAQAIAVAVHDLESGLRFSLEGDRWFHAASTIKVAVLLSLFRAADASSFHLDRDSDAMPELYQAIGRTAKISALAEGMIAVSSNLATNLLLDFVGVEYARKVLRDAQVEGVELRRGVEDHAAHERRINNEATANGLLTLLSALRGDFLSSESKEQAIRILLEQRFNSMIPAGLPAHAAVAHKTGEISTACHDMGIVYVPEREPYIAVILTEFDLEQNGRRETVAAISKAIYRSVMGMEPRSNEH